MSDENKMIQEVWQRVEEKEKILKILDGLERKDESNMLLVAKEFCERLGIRGLFYGIVDVIAVSVMITIGVLTVVGLFLRLDPQYVYSMVFIFSPTLYAGIFCLAYVKETQINTINVQMSCRYTFFHVLLFRMLLNSGLAIVFNLIYICTLNRLFDMNPVKALALSFSSLMLFSVMLLKAMRSRNRFWCLAQTCMVWFGANLLAFNSIRDLYVGFIDRIPFSVLIVAAVLFCAFYYGELKKMITMDYKRRYLNA